MPIRKWSRFLAAAFVAGALITLGGRVAVAQSTFASIVGTVQDQTASVISQATVTVRNLDENFSQTKIASDSGEFLFLNLKPGRYEVSAIKNGFNKVLLSDIRIEARQERRVTLKLNVQSVGEVVEVNSRTNNLGH